MNSGNVRIGIGFATGRKSFQKVLKTHIYNLEESGLADNARVSLNLLVAYDLNYQKTRATDFTKIPQELNDQLDEKVFISYTAVREEISRLIDEEIITPMQANLLFGKGYAAKRNAVVYFALKNKMDYLMFLDDDEYPLAVSNTRKKAVWSGQHVISTHLKYINRADITHGHHCGYISPIPYIEFDDVLTEDVFRNFVEAISNDIIKWDNLMSVMNDGGVTYANIWVLQQDDAVEVPEINHSKFISGANLCINLTDPKRLFPFYNPPGARGEDTFLSTCLGDRDVLKVPCYTFHDGFSTYNHILDGVLPIHLEFIKANNKKIIDRFYRACIGWIRYKPLLLYLTQRDAYEEKISEIREQLQQTLPVICEYFHSSEFMQILKEFNKYSKNVGKHHEEFLESKAAWAKIMEYFE